MNKGKRISIISMIIIFLIVLNIALIVVTPHVEETFKRLQVEGESKIDRTQATHTPKVFFTGNMDDMTKKSDVRNIKVKYDDGYASFTAYAKIKVQGTSSLAYPKKNYTINLYRDSARETKYKIDVGFGEQSKYCLKANWIDNTHSRNIVSARLSAILQAKSGLFTDAPNYGLIDGFPVEIYVNNKFLGLYTWNIPKDAWMWNLDEEDPLQVVVGLDKHSASAQFKALIEDWEKCGLDMEVGEYTDELKDNYNRVISFVKDSSDEEFVEHFGEYIDKDSTINYALMLYLLNATDNLDKNMMMVTYDQKYWYPSLYDLDTTFGINWDGKSLQDYSFVPEAGDCLLWQRFIPLFHDEIVARYKELRKKEFTKEYIMELFEEFRAAIPEDTLEAEKFKWPDAPGYDYDQIEEYLDYKLPFLDDYFGITVE